MLALIMGAVLTACHDGTVEPETGTPIAFASRMADEEDVTTRAAGEIGSRAMTATRATTTLGRDFVVYGYKNVNGSEQTVFNGYTVHYVNGSAHTSADNTHNYYYVGGEQLIKYWDFAASEYHFWGATINPSDHSFSSDGTTLTIPNVRLQVGDCPNPPEDGVLFSALYDRQPVSDEVVQLQFKRPYAKLRIQFYTNDEIQEGQPLSISGITFAPDPLARDPLVNKVYGQGDVVVTYPHTDADCNGKAQETIDVESLTLPQDNLPFQAIELTHELGISSSTAVTAPIDDSDGFVLDDMGGVDLKAPAMKGRTRAGEVKGKCYYYYPLPMGEKNPAFTMRAVIGGELKKAVVPAIFMQWRANYSYTYIFKITEAGKQIEFDDVLIDPWKYGGSQEDTWTNW